MIIIYGQRYLSYKNLGKVYYSSCLSCKKNTWQDLHQGRNWFSVYWIPLIPLSKDYRIRCRQCKIYFEIVEGCRELVLAQHRRTQQLLKGEITQEEYEKEGDGETTA